MIQTNTLLSLSGKTLESLSVIDPMRLPLGILTGVGFIGGGTIVKKGDLVVGVTTAATLWLVTVIGLCIGGGQLALGMVTTGLAVLTLWVLKWVDVAVPREHRAVMVVTSDTSWSALDDLPGILAKAKCHARFQERRLGADPQKADFVFELAWRRPERATLPSDMLQTVESRFQIKSFELTTENGR